MEFCFLFSSTLLIVSGVYLVYKYSEYKERKETMQRVQDPSLAQQLTIEDLDAEERRIEPRKGYQTVCLVIYVVCLLLIIVMIGARLCTLGSRISYRNELVEDLSYPSECPGWASEKGCTRISIYEGGCQNTGNLTNYRNTFNITQPAALNSKLAECLGKSVPGKIQYPQLLDGSTEW